MPVDHLAVIGEEVQFQDAQPVEFGKKIGRRLGGRQQGRLRVHQPLAVQNFVGAFEIEIIQTRVGALEGGLRVDFWHLRGPCETAAGENDRKQADAAQ